MLRPRLVVYGLADAERGEGLEKGRYISMNGMRYGWGNCLHCGLMTAATKTGLAVRHGFIRIKKGYVRTHMRYLASGQ